jgi:hypothetical protein
MLAADPAANKSTLLLAVPRRCNFPHEPHSHDQRHFEAVGNLRRAGRLSRQRAEAASHSHPVPQSTSSQPIPGSNGSAMAQHNCRRTSRQTIRSQASIGSSLSCTVPMVHPARPPWARQAVFGLKCSKVSTLTCAFRTERFVLTQPRERKMKRSE